MMRTTHASATDRIRLRPGHRTQIRRALPRRPSRSVDGHPLRRVPVRFIRTPERDRSPRRQQDRLPLRRREQPDLSSGRTALRREYDLRLRSREPSRDGDANTFHGARRPDRNGVRIRYPRQPHLHDRSQRQRDVYIYDDFGRMISQTSPVTGVATYMYDAAGNSTMTDANNATTLRTYDALNRVVSGCRRNTAPTRKQSRTATTHQAQAATASAV
jgi:YD repeat-containing protein